jgi:hypothetical protein
VAEAEAWQGDAMNLVEAARAAGAAGQDWNRWIMSDEVQDAIMAAPDFNTPEQEAIEQAFTEGRREKLAATGRIMYTTAPKDYDSGSAVELAVMGDFFGKPLRKIVVEPDDYQWQANRYGSGTYGVWDQDPIEEDRHAREKHDKHRAEMAAVDARRAAGAAWLRTATAEELANEELCEEHGATWQAIRDERTRRREEAAGKKQGDEWSSATSVIPVGATLIDDGEYIVPTMVGLRPIHRPAAVHYDVKIVEGWPHGNVERAEVHEATGKGSSKSFGTVAHVADMITRGKLRVAGPGEVPPRAVVERIGYDRWKDIRRVEVGGKIVWVGRAMFGSEDLILDENGRLVRAKKIVEAAKAEADAAERARIHAVATKASESDVGHAWAPPSKRVARRRPRGRRLTGRRGGWFGQRGRHSVAARKGWTRRR